MRYQNTVLKNGLRLITIPVEEVQSVTTLVLVGAGSRYEERKNNGISHFLEHMAFKGTKKRPSAIEISSIIDGMGAESNAFTSKEYTGYYIKSAADKVDVALDLLSDMLINLELDQNEIDKERGVIIEEINMYEDTPARKIGDVIEELLYGDVPLGWDIAGTKEVIRSVNRQDFVDYMKKWYSTDNMVLVVAGKIDPVEIEKKAEKYFAGLTKWEIGTFKKVVEKQTKPALKLVHKATEQAHFALAVRSAGLLNYEDRYPLAILASVLGGGMSSRLFSEVREKRGLAYYVRAYADRYLDTGYFAAFAGVDKTRIDEAITVVLDEFKKVVKTGEITDKEVKKAKEYNKGHFVLGLEDTQSVATFFGMNQILEKKIKTPEDSLASIEAVTRDDVERVAKKYLDTKAFNLAIIGDFKDEERFKKLIQ
ncbi:MAG TPA: pitrilysin family protein [Candidatus Levybacteria bacterium]|nr:pitrilysin family protein [Candidatus Levybacteria bacterium]